MPDENSIQKDEQAVLTLASGNQTQGDQRKSGGRSFVRSYRTEAMAPQGFPRTKNAEMKLLTIDAVHQRTTESMPTLREAARHGPNHRF
jgi:hypothetical protein